MEATLNEFKTKRKIEQEKIEQKFANRMKDLLNTHKTHTNELNSPSKVTLIKNDKFTKSGFSSIKESKNILN